MSSLYNECTPTWGIFANPFESCKAADEKEIVTAIVKSGVTPTINVAKELAKVGVDLLQCANKCDLNPNWMKECTDDKSCQTGLEKSKADLLECHKKEPKCALWPEKDTERLFDCFTPEALKFIQDKKQKEFADHMAQCVGKFAPPQK